MGLLNENQRLKRSRGRHIKGSLFLVAVLSVAFWSYAVAAPGDNVPHQFQNGGVISASSMNENFAELVAQTTLLNDRLAIVEAKTASMSVSGDDVMFQGVNVHIQNGLGATDGNSGSGPLVNALGNLIIGYNENSGSDVRTGSHNLVVGANHNYSSFGGIVVGFNNTISGSYSAVSGGTGNSAAGTNSAVSGGVNNTVSGTHGAISGGNANTCGSDQCSIAGGFNNQITTGAAGFMAGGQNNVVSVSQGTIIGGSGATETIANSVTLGGQTTIKSDYFRIQSQFTPSSGTAPCLSGQFAHDTNYLHLCTGANVWERVSVGPW